MTNIHVIAPAKEDVYVHAILDHGEVWLPGIVTQVSGP